MKNKLATFFLFSLILSCINSDEIPFYGTPVIPSNEIITIPIIVHIINYTPAQFVISDEKINFQIMVLNPDFRKLNPDHLYTPDEFMNLVADVNIEFHLATVEPNGNLTAGIIRTKSTLIASTGQILRRNNYKTSTL